MKIWRRTEKKSEVDGGKGENADDKEFRGNKKNNKEGRWRWLKSDYFQ